MTLNGANWSEDIYSENKLSKAISLGKGQSIAWPQKL